MASILGKNKVETGFRIWWDDATTPRDLSGDLVPGSISIGDEYEEADMTGVSNGLRNYLAAFRDVEITAQFHFNDTATTGASTVLNARNGKAGTLTLQWGDAGQAPEGTSLELEGEVVQLRNAPAINGNTWVHDVRWKPTGVAGWAWGTFS